MKRSDRGFQRMVLRVKPKAEPLPKAIPKKVFLGIRHKGCFSALHHGPVPEA
ncbi:MAG: hypothetical protein HY801_01760 [Candidatus Lindowbacteria bacterium]|nr:hypothetical protein [Candidatus Lindowbacteria bacterium]